MDGDISSERAARNQSLYREANEHLRPLNDAVEELGDRFGEWICECADTACVVRLRATRSEYEIVRTNPRRFIVFPSHVYAKVERVVASNERYTTVEKLDNGGQIAETLDPRKGGPASEEPFGAGGT